MTFTEAVKSVFSKYATFSGRARRKEYWYFTLFNCIIAVILALLQQFVGGRFLQWITYLYELAVLIPSLAVCCRRLHDIGRSGKWLWLLLIPLVYSLCLGVLSASLLISQPSRISPSVLIVFGLGALAMLAICIVFIVWYCRDSQPGENMYGPNPKEIPAPPAENAPAEF